MVHPHPMSRFSCPACGSRKQLRPGVCVYLCDEILRGWIYWNACDKKILFRDYRAVLLARSYLSYPKMIARARMLGWTAQSNET